MTAVFASKHMWFEDNTFDIIFIRYAVYHIPSLFQKFFQGRGHTTTSRKSTLICLKNSLYLSKNELTAYACMINFDSEKRLKNDIDHNNENFTTYGLSETIRLKTICSLEIMRKHPESELNLLTKILFPNTFFSSN